MSIEPAATVWTVAGCLFEVSLPVAGGERWRWSNPGRAVTLLADEDRAAEHHFRFRAEAEGARHGEVELVFQRGRGSDRECRLVVRVAPEHPAAGGGLPLGAPPDAR